jgi:hypothetical protein
VYNFRKKFSSAGVSCKIPDNIGNKSNIPLSTLHIYNSSLPLNAAILSTNLKTFFPEWRD